MGSKVMKKLLLVLTLLSISIASYAQTSTSNLNMTWPAHLAGIGTWDSNVVNNSIIVDNIFGIPNCGMIGWNAATKQLTCPTILNLPSLNPNLPICTDSSKNLITSGCIGTATTWSPSVLGVSWAGDFTLIAANVVNIKTDPRVIPNAAGDGSTDDTAALRAAIVVTTSGGGGTVYFPAGDYKIIAPSAASSPSPIAIPSNTILRGAGSAVSTIHMYNPSPATETDSVATWGGFKFLSSSHVGMSDLTFVAVNLATAANACAALWSRGTSGATDVFFNNMVIQLNNCRSMWFTGTTNFLLQNSSIDYPANLTPATGNDSQLGPINYSGMTNLTINGTTFTYQYGRVHADTNTHFLFQNNTVSRNAQNASAHESGGLELTLGNDVQVLKNAFTTANFPSAEVGDGESILAQLGGNAGIILFDAGSVTGTTATTLTDSAALWSTTSLAHLANFPTSTVVVITSGAAAGEIRTIASMNTGTKTLTLTQPWGPTPATGSLYATYVFPARDVVIQGNILTGNPNGIQIYDGCLNCLIGGSSPGQANTLTNSRQIMLRTFDGLGTGESRRHHEMMVNASVLNNTVINTLGVGPAYITLDLESFGADGYTAMNAFNVAIGDNIVSPLTSNPSATYSTGASEISQEGYFPCIINGSATLSNKAAFQNVYFWNNTLTLLVSYSGTNDPGTQCANLTPPPAQWSSRSWLDVGATQPSFISALNGAGWIPGQSSELITLSTGGATTDSTANLLPANSIIEAVVARVTTTITTATDWELGDATIAGRFSGANSTMTAGTTQIGTLQADQTGTSGPRQSSAAKLRITTTGTPGAGAIRVTVFYRTFVPPTN